MKLSRIFFIITICFMPFLIYSQEDTSNLDNSNMPDEGERKKKFYLYAQYGNGSVKDQFAYTGNIGIRKVGLEYRMIPEIGFGFSLGNANASYMSKPNADLALKSIYLLNHTNQTDPTNPDRRFVGAIGIVSTIQALPYSYQYNTISLDFNYHIRGDKVFDPFLGASIIIGRCSGLEPCTVTGLESRFGLQINVSNIFINGSGTLQQIKISDPTSSTSVSLNKIVSLGVGFRF